MEENKKYIRKSFWPHQYENEEQFLSKMAQNGWHFVNLYKGIPTKYEFVKGEPIDYIYQLDYVTKEEDTEDYHQLFSDAGWDEVFSWNGLYEGKWYYFRRIRMQDKIEKIFTDNESKYRMYNKLWKHFGTFALILALIFFGEFNEILSIIPRLYKSKFLSINSIFLLVLLVFICFVSIFILFFTYNILGIVRERNKIKRDFDKRL